MSNIFLKIKSYFLLVTFTVLLLLPFFSTANAQIQDNKALRDTNSVATVLCNGVKVLRGGPVKLITAMMVMVVGAGFLLGKIDIKTIIGVAVAVAVIFGAPGIYDAIIGSASSGVPCG